MIFVKADELKKGCVWQNQYTTKMELCCTKEIPD